MKVAAVLGLVLLTACGAVAPDDSGDGGADSDGAADAGSPIATFDLVIDGVVQSPESCPASHWEFDGDEASAPTVVIRNTGDVKLVYTAAPYWSVGVGTTYVPGLVNPAGPTPQDVGTLAPGESVDISAFYLGNYTALLGASKPFSLPDGGSPPSDEGTIPWPSAIPDDGDAGTMYVAQVYVAAGCPHPLPLWK